jgi:type I restriction-modification system DNA methylase subunit
MSVRNTVKSIQDIMRQDTGVDGDAQRISQLCWMFFLKIIDDQDQELELTKDGYRSPIPKQYQWRSWAAVRRGSNLSSTSESNSLSNYTVSFQWHRPGMSPLAKKAEDICSD